MSTKIYDGFYINETSIYDVMQFNQRIKPKLREIAMAEYQKVFVEAMACMATYLKYGVEFTFADLNPSEFSGSNYRELSLFVARHFREVAIKNESAVTISEFCSDLGFDFKVCYLPMKDKTLGIPYGENSVMTEAFLKEVHDYGYWNNTDKPESVSEEEWKQREKDWDIVLPGIGIPSENGLICKLLYTRDIVHIPKDETFKSFFTEEFVQRMIRKAAVNRIQTNKFEEFRKENPNEDSLKVFFRSRDYIRDHKDEVDALAESMHFDIYQYLVEYSK